MMSMGRNHVAQALNKIKNKGNNANKKHRSVGNTKFQHGFTDDTK